MRIERINADGNSCNFCQRGRKVESTPTLTFPYSVVTSIISEGPCGLHVRMCDDCLLELIDQVTCEVGK